MTPRKFPKGPVLRAAALAAWLVLLGHKLGPIPPPGKFLNPFQGFWRNAEIGKPGDAEITVPGLNGSVSVEYDTPGIPHVFAPDLRALFFAQGFATARDRLWQMDIQSRAGMGRLAEVMGKGLFRFDLERRRTGLAASIPSAWEEIRKDSLARIALESYSDGVNAWIQSLPSARLPLEFKLLDYAPEPWTPLKSVALLKNMQWTLSKGSQDEPLTHSLEKLGAKVFAELYPLRHPGSEPMIPDPRAVGGNGGGGSNNFALAGRLTKSGRPILGNDPHLDLSLPSIWYEMQLQGGGVDAYGVSLPGLPGIVIGFNRHAAWGLTNGMDDVYDWYRLDFQDSSLRQYRWNGAWHSARFAVDTIRVRGEHAVVDTQIWTHLGPVPVKNGEAAFDRNTPPLHALRWLALDPHNDVGPFLRLMSAENYPEFRRAVSGLHCPSQNFAFADSGDIALIHQGRFPVKNPGQGRTVVRGGDSAWEWRTSIPDSSLPSARNPSRGWLASANNEPMDGAYPYYLGSQFYPPERSARQRELLSAFAPRSATLEDAWNVTVDVQSIHAEKSLPLLLRVLPISSLSAKARRAVDLLEGWDYRYRADSPAPSVFDAWWKRFYQRTWEDDFNGDSVAYAWPSRPVTRELLETDPASPWFDDLRTPGRETAGAIALLALEETADRVPVGGENTERAAWGRVRPLSVPHLLRLPALGREGLSGDGCSECLNAQRGTHGPSWRMVVELSHPPKALGGYPGGQSGNPGSPGYDAFVADWLAGKPHALRLWDRPGERLEPVAYRLSLHGSPP